MRFVLCRRVTKCKVFLLRNTQSSSSLVPKLLGIMPISAFTICCQCTLSITPKNIKLLQFSRIRFNYKEKGNCLYNHKWIQLPRLSKWLGIWFSQYLDQQRFAFMMMHFSFDDEVHNDHYKTQLRGTNQITGEIKQLLTYLWLMLAGNFFLFKERKWIYTTHSDTSVWKALKIR